MPEFFCTRVATAKGHALVPSHRQDEEEIEKLPKDQPLRVKVTRMRNVDHHRKYFALLNHAFDCWSPQLAGKYPYGTVPEKNFERFRGDLIILAGFYQQFYRVDGSLRIEPKSISFGSMAQDEFEDLYTKTINVIVKHVLTQYTGDMLREIVQQIEDFE